MARYIIINADDFGLTEGVSRGILEAHSQGILTSTTFMVNFDWAPEMAELLQEAPDLGVGIHLNITTGRPVLPPERVRTLVTPDGRFAKSLHHLLVRVDRREALAEWSAQVERGLELLGRSGRRPTHLDSHRYLQVYPGFPEVLAEVARTYKIPAVRCLHPGVDTTGLIPRWLPAGPVLGRFLLRQVNLFRERGLRFPDRTLSGDFDLAGLMRRLEWACEGVTEIICHPARVDDRLRKLSSLQEQREVELAALVAPEARRKVEELGLTPVSFGHFGP